MKMPMTGAERRKMSAIRFGLAFARPSANFQCNSHRTLNADKYILVNKA